jgi:DNA-binding CsgD family transcriptional regulator
MWVSGALPGSVHDPFDLAPRFDLNLVDLHSPRSMLAWARTQMRLDPALPARLARLAWFAAQCGAVAHEAMAAHCDIAAGFAVRLGLGPHVQDAVHYQYERYDGRGLAFHRRDEAIPTAAQVLHVALAADVARGLAGAEAAAAMIRHRSGTYFAPEVAEAYLDLAGGLWPPGDDPIPLAEVLACDPGTTAGAQPGDGRLAVCEALADFADLKSAQRGLHSHTVATLAAQAAAALGLPRANKTGCAGPRWSTTWARLPCRTGCCSRQPTTPARLPGQADPPRCPSRSGCTPTTPSASWPESGPWPTWPPTSAPTTSGSTAPVIPSGSPPATCRPAPGVLAAADTWAERARGGPPDLSGEDGLDPACVAALQSRAAPGSRHHSERCGPSPALPALSSRELQVLQLLTDGASNPDISKALFISRRTTEHHVEHILTKLGVTSRTAAVAYALTHELLP